MTHASRGPGPLGELRGKGRGGLCLKHTGIASGVGLHLVELVGVDPPCAVFGRGSKSHRTVSSLEQHLGEPRSSHLQGWTVLIRSEIKQTFPACVCICGHIETHMWFLILATL